jgi:hypothetical protein
MTPQLTVTVKPPSVFRGKPATVTVQLADPAPSGGADIAISYDNPAVSGPSSLTIPEGGRQGGFGVETSIVEDTVVVHVGASYGGAQASAALEIVAPVVQLKTFTIAPASVSGGTTVTGDLTLTSSAHGGLRVEIETTDPHILIYPRHLNIGEGLSRVDFDIRTRRVQQEVDGHVLLTYKDQTLRAGLRVT